MTGIPLTSSAKKSMLIAEYLLRCAKESTSDHAAVLCEYVESCLSHAKTYLKLHVVSTANDKSLLLDIGAMYYTLATIYKSIGNQDSANNCFKKAEKRKYVPGQHQVSSSLPGSQSLSRPQSQSQSQPQSQPQSQFTMSAATSPEVNPALGSTQRSDNTCIEKAFESNYQNVFPANISQDSQAIELPEFSQPFTSISQLIHCVTLIHDYHNPSGSSDKILTDKEHKWLQKISNYSEFQKKIQELPGLIITIFTNDNSKPPASVSEVVLLAPVLQKQRFRGLLCSFVEKVNSSKEIIQEYLLEGMAQLIQNSPDGYLDSNDLVQILNLLINLLQNVHGQDTKIVYQLVSTISRLLDAMADIKVHDVDRTLLCSLSACLEGLMHYNDSCVVYQAAYASQALLYVPDDVSPTQLVMQRAVKVFKGASTIVRAVKGFDIDGFIDGLADIQRGLPITEIYDLAKTAYEGYKSLKESGQDFYSAVKECISFDKQSAWYPALRGIDILVTTGQLAEFKELVNKASCQPQRLFLWGVTERLGRIAIESKWKLHVQCHAIDFLSEIYSNDQRWGQQADVKQWILQVLIQVKGTTDGEIRTHAIDTLTKLQELGNENKRNLYQDTIKEGSGLYSLECLLPHLNGFALLNQAQNKPQVEIDIEKVKWMRMSEYKQDIYITQRAKPSLQANNNNATDLMTKVQEFIKGRSEVFLILGDSGSGKSTFNQRLENELWNSYNPNEDFIPLFINLPSIDKPEYDMVSKRLQSLGFTDAQIRELRSSRKFILICDGYDELQRTGNLYISNNINRKDGWNAKMIISCRSEYVGDKYRSDFEPVYDRNDIEGSKSLEEAVIVPFLDFQVDSYIKEFVANDSSLWSFDTYQKAIQQNSDIKNLISNPFLLKVVVEALPRMISPDSKFEDIQVTRYSLYEQFVTRWIERNKKRAEEYSEALLKTAYKKLNQEGLGRNGMLFMTNLAVKIYKEQNGNPVVEYIRLEDKSTWKDEFFGWENEKQILIEVCPLISTGSQYRFFHKSILEYFVARSVCRSLTQTRGRGVECIRDQNEEGVDATQDDTAASNDLYVKGKSIVESIIGSINIVKEPSIVSFLSDCIEKEPFLKEELLEVIEQSKTDKSVQVAATNAITVLVRAGVPFHQKDLRGICIPGADLSQGKFDNAQLQGSDLSNTTMKNIWMRGANLSDSKMGGIYFGQRAYLEIGHDYGNGISSIRYSSDEKRVLFAGGKYSYCSSFGVFIFNTLTWEQEVEIEFRCDSQYFKDALFTYDNQQVIMILDNRICIWDTRTVKEVFSNSFKSEVLPCYCLSRHELAIVDDEENIIRIISITEDKCLHELKGHTGPINWLSYSPSGSIIVSCDKDKFICLWNTQTGEVIKTIVEDTGVLYKVVWNIERTKLIVKLEGMDNKLSVGWDNAFPPKLVSTYQNQTAVTLELDISVPDMDMFISEVAFSPDCRTLALYYGWAYEAKLWDTKTGAHIGTLSESIEQNDQHDNLQ
ncbi:hypothetical protein BGX21_001543 [Mortierella sp. AD011]|nr:hypothetical protein BGX21_001543 [Mortierella sp. AD011]